MAPESSAIGEPAARAELFPFFLERKGKLWTWKDFFKKTSNDIMYPYPQKKIDILYLTEY